MCSVNRPRSAAPTTADVTADHRTGLHNRRQLTTLTSTDALSERHCVQTPLLAIGFVIFELIGVGYFIDGDAAAPGHRFGLMLGCLMLIISPVGIWRAIRLGLVIDAKGLRIRSFDSRDRVISWNEVEAIDCQQVDARAGIPLYAPVIHLRGEGIVMMRAFGSYSRAAADRRVEQLRSFKSASEVRVQD